LRRRGQEIEVSGKDIRERRINENEADFEIGDQVEIL
jgi:hypothetical protein